MAEDGSAPRSVVIGVDTSPCSSHAVAFAVKQLYRPGDEIHLAYCYEEIPDFDVFFGEASKEKQAEQRKYEQKLFHEFVASTVLNTSGAKYRMHFVEGDPREAIPFVAKREKADVIVVGSHGKGMMARAMLGSVSTDLAHTSHLPLVIVRFDDKDEEAAKKKE